MARWRVPLTDVVVPEEDIEAVAAVYRSGWLSMGPQTAAFEEAFAAYTGARHALAVSSGTAALHLMCLAIGLGPGDEVIVPSLTFVATANAIAYTGARTVFADIAGVQEPWLSAASAEAALTPRTRAVLAVHYGGHAGEAAALRSLTRRHGLILLEDAAHAAGSRSAGKHLGTLGLAGAFSFFPNKNLGIGEGGVLVTDDDDVAARARLLRSHGMTTLTWDRYRGHASAYDVVALGFNYRIDEPRAALARERLLRLDAENRRRARLAARYRAALEGHVALPAAPADGLESSHHLFTIVVEPGADRDGIRAQLAAAGIETSVHYPPVHGFAIYRDGAPELPLTDDYARRTISLPIYAHMTDDQQDLVVDALLGTLRHA